MLSSEHCLDCSTSDLFPKKKTATAWRKGERKVGEGEGPPCMPWGYTVDSPCWQINPAAPLPNQILRPGQLPPPQTKVQVLTAQQLKE